MTSDENVEFFDKLGMVIENMIVVLFHIICFLT